MFPLILLYVALTILRPQDYLPGMENVPLLPAVLALAFVAWLFSSAKNFEAPQFVILPAFLLVLMASQVVNGWTGGAMDELARFGPVVAAYFVLASACHTQRRACVTMGVFVACAAILALHGVEQAHTGTGWTGIPLSEGGRIQYVGIFNDPNDLGLLFAATLPMAVFLGRRGAGAMRSVWLAAAVLLLYGTYLTNSRGAMLAVLMVAGCYLWYRKGVAVAGVLGVAGLAVMKLLSSRMSELDAGEESAAGRVDAWYEGLQMFREHPLFGVGAGNFTEHNYLTAHNSFVLALAETGFVGYTLWLAFVGYCFIMMYTILRHRPPLPDAAAAAAWKTEQSLALALFVALIGFFVAAFFLSRSYVIILYLVAALVVGDYTTARSRFPTLPAFSMRDHWMRWMATSAIAIVVLYALVRVLL